MTKSQVQNYDRAIRNGFPGTFEEYLKEAQRWRNAWGRKRDRVNGHLVWFEECIECGTDKRPHAQDGYCTLCYERTPERVSYKQFKNAQYNANRRNKLQTGETTLRNTAG